MADNRDIRARVLEFVRQQAGNDPEAVRLYFGYLYESYCAAERSAERQTVAFIGAWALVYAIGAGLISEAGVSSFKVANVASLVVFAPPTLGYLSCTLAAAFFHALNLGPAVSEFWKHLLPKAYDQYLDELLGAPTVLHAERMMRRGEHRIHMWTSMFMFVVVVMVGLLGTTVAVGHASILAWRASTFPWYVRSASIAIGLVFWLRGLLLWVRAAYY